MAGKSNDFKIVISATDKATASIRRINDSISRMTRPFENVQKSMGSLGREIGRNQVVKGLVGIERAAVGVAGTIARIGAPMAALIGVGSIAGINSLVTGWGHLGFELSTTSATLGMSSQALHAWRGAAKLAGVSTEAMTGSLSSFGTTLQDATYGRNGEALEMMRLIGLQLHRTSTGAIDTNRAMMDLSKILSSPAFAGKAQEQGLISRVLGTEASLSMLRQGPDAIRKFMQEAQLLNPYLDPAKAEAYAKEIFRMETAFDGLKNTIGSALMPVMMPLVQQFTRWVALNQKPIGENLGIWVKKMADYFKSGEFDSTLKKVESVGNALVVVADGVLKAVDAYNRLRPPDLPDNLKYNSALNNKGGAAGGKRDVSGTISGTSTAGGGRRSAGNWGMHYDDPELNAYANLVEQRLGLTPNILNGIKNFGEKSDPNSVSPKGARGVMQFMPETWKQYGNGGDPSNPRASIDAAGAYLKDMMKRYNGNDAAAITEFNGGIAQARAVAAGGKPWVAETQHYVERVQGGMAAMNAQVDHSFTMDITGLPAGASARVTNEKTGQNVPVRTSSPMPMFGA